MGFAHEFVVWVSLRRLGAEMGSSFRSCMGQCVDPYRPMVCTARGIKHPEVPRIIDLRYSLNTRSHEVRPKRVLKRGRDPCTVALEVIG